MIACRIQAAQAAAVPASASAAPALPTQEAPALPPLPPEEELQNPPPPPPPESWYPPPLPPAAAPLPLKPDPGQHHSRWSQEDNARPSIRSMNHSQWSDPEHPSAMSGRTGGTAPAGPMHQSHAALRTASHAGLSRAALQTSSQPGVHVKTEPHSEPKMAGFVKPEAGSMASRSLSGSHAPQVKQEAQPSGAIQFGFGGSSKSKAAGQVCFATPSVPK